MPSMIDHIVIVDQNLDKMVQQAESIGFTVVPGGEHAGGMTHNALIAFQDRSYIELIAFIEPEQRSTHRWWPRLWKGGGLVDFALLCDDLESEVEEIRHRGLEIPEPIENGRLRPDKQRLEWRQSFPQAVVGDTGMPFLIDDVTPRSLRVPAEPHETTHPNGVTGIAGITLLVDDLGAASKSLGAITGNEVISTDPPLPGMMEAARTTVGPDYGHWIVAAAPDMTKDEGHGDDALPARYLEKYGSGPFTALLTTGSNPQDLTPSDGDLVDVELLAASRLRIV